MNIYDERPGFESYNMMNMPYPNMPVMYPNNNTCTNNIDNKLATQENTSIN